MLIQQPFPKYLHNVRGWATPFCGVDAMTLNWGDVCSDMFGILQPPLPEVLHTGATVVQRPTHLGCYLRSMVAWRQHGTKLLNHHTVMMDAPSSHLLYL